MESTAGRDTAPVQPRRVRAARDLRGLTQTEVVQRMATPISAAALSQIEAGKIRPTEETLADLADALEIPPGFFTASWPEVGDGALLTYFRHLRSTPMRERRRAAALVVLLGDLLAALELHVRLPEPRIPSIPIAVNDPPTEIDSAADAVRDSWQLGHDPIPHVVRELERHGIVVARLTMGHRSVDAFAARCGARPIVFLTEDKSNYVRSRFDAAHELGHLVMHRSFEPGSPALEQQAHDFAASFLLPRRIALEVLPSRLDATGWTRLAELKRRWGISMNALLYRSRKLQILSVEAYRNAMKFVSSKGWRTTEPGDREMGLPEAPLLLERALSAYRVATGDNLESFLRSASLPFRDIAELLEAAADPRPTVEL